MTEHDGHVVRGQAPPVGATGDYSSSEATQPIHSATDGAPRAAAGHGSPQLNPPPEVRPEFLEVLDHVRNHGVLARACRVVAGTPPGAERLRYRTLRLARSNPSFGAQLAAAVAVGRAEG